MEKKSSKKKEEVDKTKQYKAPSKKKQASGKNTKASGKKPTKEEVKNMSKEQRKAYKKILSSIPTHCISYYGRTRYFCRTFLWRYMVH